MNSQLGIDIAKRKFDVALLSDGKYKTRVFDNTQAGFGQLVACVDENASNDRPQ